MATPPSDATISPPSSEAFLTSARALGAVIHGESVRFERDGRGFFAGWKGPGKSSPPRLMITTPAGPRAQPQVKTGVHVPTSGPFRGDLRPRITSPAPLTLRLETRVDRAGKSLRINRETQTGDAVFDERIYLESEATDDLVLAVLADPSVRANVISCLTLGAASLTLDAEGNLGIDFPLPSEDAAAPARLALLLDTLAAAAEAIPPLQGEPRRRTFAGRLSIVAVLGTLVSWPLYYLVNWLWEPIGNDLYASAALGGLALWIVTLPVLYFVLRGRAVSLRELLTSAIALAIGFPLGGADLLLTLNGALDTSRPEPHATQVTRLRSSSGKGSSYHVTVVSWHPGEEAIEIKISSALYSTLSRGQQLTVTTRQGFLGWERMTSMVPVTGPRTSN